MTIAACRCGAHWTGLHVAHCGACHLTFATPVLFDAHRVAEGARGSCRDPLTDPHLSKLRFHDGMWRNPEMTPERRERVNALAQSRKPATGRKLPDDG